MTWAHWTLMAMGALLIWRIAIAIINYRRQTRWLKAWDEATRELRGEE